MNACVARAFGTKVVFISGTDAGVEEVKEEIPDIHSMVATISYG